MLKQQLVAGFSSAALRERRITAGLMSSLLWSNPHLKALSCAKAFAVPTQAPERQDGDRGATQGLVLSPSCRRSPAAAGPCSYIALPASVSLPATPRPSCIILLHGCRALSLELLQPLTMCACFVSGAQEPPCSFRYEWSTTLVHVEVPLLVNVSLCARLCWSLAPSDASGQQ